MPLAYLDPTSDGEVAVGSRLFAAQIDLLDKKDDEFQSSQPRVLLAQSNICGRLYAIERVHRGLYASCRLGQWVAETALEDLAQRPAAQDSYPPSKARHEEQDLPAGEWWRNAVAPDHEYSCTSSLDPAAVARARNFRLSLERPSKGHELPALASVPASPAVFVKASLEQTERSNDVKPTPEESPKIIKTHYQDALYLSRAPLAYFAKGPLSRARASYQQHESSSHDYSKLTEYLRTMILDLPLMDKKYKETLPEIIKDFPFAPLSDGEGAPIIAEIQKRSRRSKKDKVGKNGLYVGEDVTIARWWLGRDIPDHYCGTEDAHQESLKATVLNLRRREAQLQIILLLETLALEENSTATVETAAIVDEISLTKGGSTPKAQKAKKPRDLNTLLDLLADRLSIWQSMTVEVEKPAMSQRLQEGIAQESANHTSSDELRQFCIDVVIPL